MHGAASRAAFERLHLHLHSRCNHSQRPRGEITQRGNNQHHQRNRRQLCSNLFLLNPHKKLIMGIRSVPAESLVLAGGPPEPQRCFTGFRLALSSDKIVERVQDF